MRPASILSVLLSFTVLCALPCILRADSYTESPAAAIPDDDPNGVHSEITVSDPVDPMIITALTVTVDITHSFRGDLYVTLTSPDGSVFVLHNRRGLSADDLKVTYDTGAMPEDSLRALNGRNVLGTWRLTVSDRQAGDTGTFNSWTLAFERDRTEGRSTVSGNIRYEDRILTESGFTSSRYLPVRHADVELVRDSDGVVVGSGVTDDSGDYSFEVVRQGAIDCYLRVYARSCDSVRLIQVLDDDGNRAFHTMVSSVSSRDTDTDFTINLDATFDGGSGPGGAFNILDQAEKVFETLNGFSVSRPPMVTYYWKHGATKGTNFQALDNSIYVLGMSSDTDEYDDSVILHETGHFVAAVYSRDASPGGSHTYTETSQDMRLSWSEGWATYFGQSILGNPEYLDSNAGGGVRLDLEQPSYATSATGQDTEVAVFSCLWDIFDGAATPDDSAGADDDFIDWSGAASNIFEIFDGYFPTGFSNDITIFEGFHNGWVARFGADYFRTELAEIYAERSIYFARDFMWSSEPSAAIPDQGQVSDTVSVNTSLTLETVNVFVNIEHSYPGDLIVSLRHPDGTTVRLHNRTDGTASDRIIAWYQAFHSDPVDPLSTFRGKPSAGTWELIVSDNAELDTGTLKSWKLHLDGAPVAADLLVDSVTAPASAVRGQTMQVGSVITNRGGTAVSGTFKVTYYASSDRTITSADTPLAVFDVAGISAGQSLSHTRTITVPTALSAGPCFIGAIVDWDYATGSGSVDEALESNNDGVAASSTAIVDPSAGVDLFPANVNAPVSAVKGGTMTVDITVTNSGGSDADGFVNRVYLSSDTFINAVEDTLLGEFVWSGLDMAASQTVSRAVTIPATAAAGDYYVGVIVDAGGRVVETNEGNNVGFDADTVSVIDPVAGVDLVVDDVQGPSGASPGAVITVSSTVRNAGDTTAAAYVENYYLTGDMVIDGSADDVLLGSFSVSGLDSTSSAVRSRSVTIPATAALGDYYIGLLVDSVEDVDLTNNSAFFGIRVSSPDIADIVPTNIVAPATMVPGSAANVTYSVSNSGSAATRSFYVDFYLSADRDITTSDYFFTRHESPALGGAAGGTYTVQASLPSTMPAGTYYLGLIADSTGLVAESREDNNVLADTQTVEVSFGALPDLVPDSLSMSTTAAPGGRISLSWRMKNTGSGATSGSFINRFYLSSDAVPSADDVLLGEYTETSYLLPGADFYRSAVLTVPASLSSGAYYVWLTADAGDIVLEQYENNNTCVSATVVTIADVVAGYDLVPGNLVPPARVTVGAQGRFQGGVSNIGQQDVDNSFRVVYYLSPDTDISSSDTLLTSTVMPGITGGGSAQYPFIATVPATIATGTYYLGAIVDPDDDVAGEADETNNSGASVTTVEVVDVPSGIDLTPLYVDNPSSVPVGGALDVDLNLANHGDTASGGPFDIRVLLSVDSVVDTTDTTICMYTFTGSLAALVGATCTIPCTVPGDLAPGVYNLAVVIDDGDVIAEYDETNNELFGNVVNVTAVSVPPDLVVSDVSAPLYARVGGYLSVGRTVKNIGKEDVKTSFDVAYYLSVDQAWDAGDFQLASFSLSGLDAGAQNTRSTSMQIPPGIAAGDYYVLVRADDSDDVAEGVESNNVATSTATVSISASPDLIVSNVSASPDPVTVGQTMTISRRIDNLGAADCDSIIFIRYYLSTDVTIETGTGGDKIIHTEYFDPGTLASGANDVGTTTVDVPAMTAAWDYYIGAYVDVLDRIPEENENNNITTGTLSTIAVTGAPDLQALSVSAISTGVQGTPILVTLSVKNYQNTTAPAFTAQCRLSSDAVYDATDTALGLINFSGLQPGETAVEQGLFNIPAVAGAYYTVAWVDPEGNGSIYETVEGPESNSVCSATTDEYSVPDVTPPTVAISYFSGGAEIGDTENIPAGSIVIVASFSEDLLTTPAIAVDQPGTADLPPTPMQATPGNSARWFYSYDIPADDGGANIDGWNDILITSALDLQGNAFAPPNADSFRTDTIVPSIVMTSPVDQYPVSTVPPGTYTFSGTITDASTVAATYSINWSPVSSLTVTAGAFSENFSSPLTSETDLVVLRAEDPAGNWTVKEIRLVVDTDADGVPDWYEALYEPVLDRDDGSDAFDDPDGDGLVNIDEYRNNTDPTVADNDVPVADAGADRTVPGGVVILDGTGSHTTPAGGALLYRWNQEGGPAAVIIADNGTARPSFTAGALGVYSFSLQVSDDNGGRWSVPDYVDITVVNAPPYANAGFLRVATAGSTFNLDASRSLDPDGYPVLNYYWDEDAGNPGPVGVAFPLVTPAPFTAVTPSVPGVYVFYLDVEDIVGDFATRPTSVTIIVTGTGVSPPTADAGPVRSCLALAAADLDGRASVDCQSDPAALTYSWTQLEGPVFPGFPAFDDSLALAPFTAGVLTRGRYAFELDVQDPGALSAPLDCVKMLVHDAGDYLPKADAGADQSGDVTSTLITLNGSASFDSEGASLTVTWVQIDGPDVELSDPAGLNPYFGARVHGRYRFRLYVSDAAAPPWLDYDDVEVVIGEAGNVYPTVAVSVSAADDPDHDGRVAWTGGPVTLDATVADGDSGPGTIISTWTQVGGPWVVLSPLTTVDDPDVTFVPPRAGVYSFEIHVSDGAVEVSSRIDVVIDDSLGNHVPHAFARIDPASDSDGDGLVAFVTGKAVRLDASLSYDADSDILEYQWEQTGGPWVILDDPNSVSPSFVPPSAAVYSFVLKVLDGHSPGPPALVTVRVAGGAGGGGGGGGGCSVSTALRLTADGLSAADRCSMTGFRSPAARGSYGGVGTLILVLTPFCLLVYLRNRRRKRLGEVHR